MRKILALGSTLAAAVLGLGLASTPAQAADQGTTGSVDCYTGVDAVDKLEGFAGCTNHTNGPVEFRVDLVCGWAPDVSGAWVRLEPGQGNQSIAHCAAYSSGIGEVHATHRPA